MAEQTTSADSTKRSPKESFLTEVHARYKRCVEAEQENRDRALEALRFRNLEQWDDKIKRDRETDPEGARPCLVLDKLNQHVNQVVNDQRMNRPQIKVNPADDAAHIETAKIFDGMIRQIQVKSRADIAFDTGFEHAVDGGFGYWRVKTQWSDEMSFEQDAAICRVRNRFAVYLDPDRQEPDGSDSKFGFVVDRFTTENFKRDYPKAKPVSFEADGKTFKDWCGQEWVLVAEHYWIEPERVAIVMLADPDGTVVRKDDYTSDAAPKSCFEVDPVTGQPTLIKKAIQKERVTIINRVLWRKVTATDIVEPAEGVAIDDVTIVKAEDGLPAQLWAGRWIPIVEVIGNELDIEGKAHRSGLIRGAMDAQRVYNYSGSSFVEQVALAPRAPLVAAVGQLEGQENEWRSANRRNISVLQYHPIAVENVIVPAPVRQPSPGIPAGWQAALANAEHDIESSLGRYAATLGAPSNEKSGRAINARNREGDVGTFHFQDNETRSMHHTGRILVDLVPRLCDTKRRVRIIGEDGETKEVVIDPDLKDEITGKPIAYLERKTDDGATECIYNLSIGKYEVTIGTGPSFTTRRQEAAEFLTSAVQSARDPVLANALIYLAMKNQDFAGSDEAVTILKKMLPPGIIESKDDQTDVIQTPQGPIPVEQAGQVIAQLSQKLQEVLGDKDATKEKAGLLDLQVRAKELQQRDRELDQREKEIAISAAEAETTRAEAAARMQHTQHETARAQAETSGAAATATAAETLAAGAQQIGATAALLAQTVHQIAAARDVGDQGAAVIQEALARSLDTQAVMLEANARSMQALEAVIAQSIHAQMAPRKIELVNDSRGMPVGAVSTVQ